MFNFFKKSAFGLDISDYSVEVLELKSKISVKNFARMTLNPGFIKGGLILNKKALTQSLKEFLKTSAIKTQNVVLSLPESKIFFDFLAVPRGLKGKKLKRTILAEAQKNTPFRVDKIYWDYKKVKTVGPKQFVIFIAIFKEIANDYSQLLIEVGLKPIVLETEAMALGRAILKSKKKVCSMIVDIGARTANISIFNGSQNIEWLSKLPIGGNYFTQLISNNLSIDFEEADKIKKENGLTGDVGIATIIQNGLKDIIQEVKNVICNYERPIENIFLTGGSAKMAGIANYFSEQIKKDVKIGKSTILEKIKNDSVFYNTVIGLALRGLSNDPKRGINLLPPNKFIKQIEKEFSIKPTFKVRYIFVFFFLIFCAWFISFEISNQKENLPLNNQRVVGTAEEIERKNEIIVSTENSDVAIIKENEIIEGGSVLPINNKETQSQSTELVSKITAKITVKNNISRLNVRQKPTTDSQIVAKINSGEAYDLIEQQDNWYKIQVNVDLSGWIASDYAILNKVTNNQPREIPLSQKETPVTINNEQIDIPVEIVKSVEIIEPTEAVEDKQGSFFIVLLQNNLWLNVRKGPGLNYQIVSKIYPDQKYDFVEERDGWYEIKLDNQIGWVFSQYVSLINEQE